MKAKSKFLVCLAVCAAMHCNQMQAAPKPVSWKSSATQISLAEDKSSQQPANIPTNSGNSDIDALETAANDAFWKRNFKSAQSNVESLLKKSGSTNEFRGRCLTNLSICEAQLDQWDNAREHALLALKLVAPQSLTAADASLVYARCLLVDGKLKKALPIYEKALAAAVAVDGPWNTDVAPFNEGLAGCYMNLGMLDQAETNYRTVAQLDLLKYGADDTSFGWSLLSLCSVEKRLGHGDLAETLYKKVFWNFRHQNEIRILSEHKDAPDQVALTSALQDQLYGSTGGYRNRELGVDYIKKGIPAESLANPSQRSHTFDQWFMERVGRDEAPGLAFFDPTKPLKALIVTVHGLGLHHGAFTPFAEKVQHEGLGVVSFDVRGFGSYRNDVVYQRLDLNAVIADLKRILSELRLDYPNTPIVLLGESMGGAIVLRVAAEAPNLVDAVVSSVPSGSRYKGKRTAFEIGLKLLKDKHEQFDIGTKVVTQATLKPDLRDMWEGDPNVRLKLSPSELLNFQKFMGENIKYAQMIKHTPVIMFQGYSDNLVKPMGTLAIYHAIANRDKDLVFVGRAEHLIFEEGQFDPSVYNGVVGWIVKHLPSSKINSAAN